MEKLQNLTPEQIAALSPECMKILLGVDTKEKDIAKLKSNFEQIVTNSRNKNPNLKNQLQKINELLKKYSEDNFFLLPCSMKQHENDIDMQQLQRELAQCMLTVSTVERGDYSLLTLDEINKLLPTGCDLYKIIHRLLPEEFGMPIPSHGSSGLDTNTMLATQNLQNVRYLIQIKHNIVTDIVRENPNVYFIHPVLLLCASHIFSSHEDYDIFTTSPKTNNSTTVRFFG